MKIFIVAMLIAGSILSCSKADESINEDLTASYVLTKMSARFEGSETTGLEMEWQETYCLYKNNTFIKSRNWNGNVIEASGVYSFSKIENENYIDLSYNSESTIIASCYGNLKETLLVINETKIVGTWSHCDGPGLEYEKVVICGLK